MKSDHKTSDEGVWNTREKILIQMQHLTMGGAKEPDDGRKMRTFFDYLFYRFYKWSERFGFPSFAIKDRVDHACTILTAFFCAFFILVFFVIVRLLDQDIWKDYIHLFKYYFLIGGVCVWLFIKFIWGSEDQLSILLDRYAGEKSELARRRGVIIVISMVGVMVVNFLLAYSFSWLKY